MKKHIFQVFERMKDSHTVIYIIKAHSLWEAVINFVKNENSDVQIHKDKSLSWKYRDENIYYNHVLEYLENMFKVFGEWQIREFTEAFNSDNDIEQVVVGESIDGVDNAIQRCLPSFLNQHLIKKYKKPKAFIWELNNYERLVTFYKRDKLLKIKVLGRYILKKDGTVVKCDYGYQDIFDRLRLKDED